MDVRALEVRYGRRAHIGPVTLGVRRGQVLGLIGANGSGKTTVLRTICALQAPHQGTAQVLGRPVVAGTPVPGLGAMIEEPRFYTWLSGLENLRLAAGGRTDWTRRIDAVLDEVALTDVARTPVAEYSQGMRQRLGLARAMLGDPHVLVLDEPTNGVDFEMLSRIRDVLRERAAAGVAIILTSHLIAEVEATSDVVAIMHAGRLLRADGVGDVRREWGSLQDLYERVTVGSG